jgi:hypothetical protein
MKVSETMFIKNFESLSDNNTYKCGKTLGKHLVKVHEIPVLSFDEKGNYIFNKTEKLQEALNNLPIHMRFLK